VVNETKRNREQQRRRRSDFRVICDCQRHRRSASPFWRIASRGAAVLVSLPLAFAALDLPISAMSLKVVDGEFFQAPKNSSANVLPMFTIFREARRNDLPPELVAAMVHTESDFRPGLISNKRAQGLMQIVPSTARLLGINDPFDPQQNIAAGTKYFRYLLNRFDNETMALAAYNAGEGNVVRFGGIPPFPETRDYIVKVNRRTDRYRQRVHNTYLAMVRVRNADLAQ
jgi:soluble lytic murein transglycosylase-like protein